MSDLQFMPVNEPIAQCEYINLQTHNPLVAGSNPAGPTNSSGVCIAETDRKTASA